MRLLGAVPNSGWANTGEQRYTRGGEVTYSSWSGVAVDTLVVSGPGRLNSLTRLSVASGGVIVCYDGNIATSGGPFATSGHRVLGVVLQPLVPAISGFNNTPQFATYGVPVQVDMPFANGLIAACVASGTPAFNLSYTVETLPTNN